MSKFRLQAGSAVVALVFTAASIAQSAPANAVISANDLVRAVIANELRPTDGDQSRWMYEVSKEEDGHRQTKEVVQTRQGALERLVAIDGNTLSLQKQDEERSRISSLISHPQEQQKLEQVRKKDAAQCEAFFRMLPDAFIFSYGGREGELIRLTFKPNPAFQPPSREARVFHAMEGEMLIQSTEQRLSAIRGRLVEDVKFGGGWLGHLERGGQFSVERKDIAPGHWELTAMQVSMKGKVLFMKTISVQQKESRQSFRRVADNLNLKDAAELLDNHVVLAARQ
jgi:hypothetical protein